MCDSFTGCKKKIKLFHLCVSKQAEAAEREILSQWFWLNLCVKVAKSRRELICLLYFVYLLLHQAQINGNPSVTCSTTSPRTSHLGNWRTHKSYNELLLSPLILSLKAGAVKLGRAQVFCLKAFTPRGAPLIIFYSNVSARKVTKPEVYCPLIYPPSPCRWDEVDYTVPIKLP